ncbi:MAG TPA: hypothetical protein VF571_15460 [Pyrinomonadaceae bacterium]|jgi:hypothetical protein
MHENESNNFVETEKLLSNVDDYLTYQELARGEFKDLFEEPLEFIRLLDEATIFFKENKSNPLAIRRYFEDLKLSEQQLFKLCCEVFRKFAADNVYFTDEQIENSIAELISLASTLECYNGEMDDWERDSYGGDGKYERATEKMDAISEELDKLPTDKARMFYLRRYLTEYEHEVGSRKILTIMHGNIPWLDVDDFYHLLKSKLSLYEKLFELECAEKNELGETVVNLVKQASGTNTEDSEVGNRNSELEKIKDLKTGNPSEHRTNGGTQYQNLLAMYFLFDFLQVKCRGEERAKFISFLTGYSSEKIRQLFPKVLEKSAQNWTKWEKDAQIVKERFEKLGLKDTLGKMIENEIENQKNNL